MNQSNTYISAFLPVTKGDKKAPSTVVIRVPVAGSSPVDVTGIIDNDVTFSLSNRFAPILPDTSDLQEIFSIFESGSMPSWIGTSSQVWKGTNPISFSFDMYIINWSPDCKSESNLERLAQLCTVSPAPDSNKGDPSKWTVSVHGGYKPAILADNRQWFTGALDGSGISESLIGRNSDKSGYSNDAISSQKTRLDKLLAVETTGESSSRGMVTLFVGSRTKVSNLLLTRCDITPSVVEVYSPTAGVPPRPLYYRVGLSFQTARTALSTDIPGLFGLS